MSLPPGVLSASGAAIKVGTALSLVALIAVTVWGAIQVYSYPRASSGRVENLPSEADVARVFALCAAGDAAGARAVARSFVRRHPTSPERARVEDACSHFRKRPD